MNNTMQETQLNTLTLDRELLNDLLTGALVAADKSKHAIAKLGSVYLSAQGGKVIVNSTDRYKLVNGVADYNGADVAPMQILVADVKRILTLLKDNKLANEITLTRAGDSLSVAALGNSLTIYLMGDTFPPIEQLINQAPAELSGLSLNANFIGDFAKVPSTSNGQINLTFTAKQLNGENMPTQIKISVPHDRIAWRCLLMPMRVSA